MDGGRRQRLLRLSIGCGLFAGAATAQAECLSLVSGPIQFDVAACVAVQPEQAFDTTKERFSWVKDLDPEGKAELYDNYRGLYLKGKVVKSSAVAKGLSNEAGALHGEQIAVMVPPGQGSCDQVAGKRLSGTIREVCCDGGGAPPCLLGTSYLLPNPTVLGAVSSGAGDATRQKAAKNADYKAGATAFKAGKWKDAAKSFEKARTNGELDVRGHYNLGFAYRKLDQCSDAIQPLKHVYDLASKKQIGADEDPIARKATFLLARCYSKMNEPGPAVLILQGYLLEPQKYRSELKQSLSHKDFGWIHTSKEYRDYKKDAQKKLKN